MSAETIESSRMNRIASVAILIICRLILIGAASAGEAELPLNPAVTQATITDTVCVAGWTKSIRPYFRDMPTIKAEMLAAIGESHEHRNRFRLDHRIPLALGGATIDRRNLMLQPMAVALEKDAIERYAMADSLWTMRAPRFGGTGAPQVPYAKQGRAILARSTEAVIGAKGVSTMLRQSGFSQLAPR